jgi:hypothetical protein
MIGVILFSRQGLVGKKPIFIQDIWEAQRNSG